MVRIAEASIEDLYQVEGQAELIDGTVVEMGSTGYLPSLAAGEIYASLREYAIATRRGLPFTDNMTYAVSLPARPNRQVWTVGLVDAIETSLKRRRSFSPDASFYRGNPPEVAGDPISGAPTFAVEVRSKQDYGDVAELAFACKLADYFDAGTQVVWDVDVLRQQEILAYRADAPRSPQRFRRGDIAAAELVLPDWQFAVDSLFRGWFLP